MNAWLVLMTLLQPYGGCQAIRGDQIFGADLARVLPVFSSIPRDAVIANSPAPGNRRMIDSAELARIGRQYGVEAPANGQVCFAWKMRALSEDDVRAAIRESMQSAGARIDVLAMSKTEVPDGKLLFPLSGLSASANVDPATPVTWRGEVEYHSVHKFAIWARVRITAKMTRVVAKELLLPGQTVTAEQVRVETLEDFPLRNNLVRSLEDVVGRATLRAIQPGAPLFRADLSEPFQVRRGESVFVTAVSGAAQLTMQAVAQNSGKQGEMISLRNPNSGRIFRARIEGHDQALVITGPIAIQAEVQ